MSIESVMPSNYLIPCCPLLLLPSTFPSMRVFSNESALCIRWPKYWSFSFSMSPSNEYSGLISFRIDWFDLLSNASVLRSSAFFMVQLSNPYITTGKTIALTRQTFADKVMSLLFNMHVEIGHSFSSKEQVSFNFMAAVTIYSDFGAPKNKVCHCCPIYVPLSDGTRCHDLRFLNVDF